MSTIYSIFIISDVFHSIRITPHLQETPKIKSSRILYIPIIANAIPEVDESSCRWSYTGSPLLIYYKWGNNLQTPGSLWRTAFESGISAWNSSLAHIVYWYSNNTPNFIDTYSASDGNRGTTVQICTAGGVALRWEIRGNIYYESDGYTINMRRGIATHEIGHGAFVGHIPNAYPIVSLMYKIMSLAGYDAIYVPQTSDVQFINQYYP